jgi:hypothetical protein
MTPNERRSFWEAVPVAGLRQLLAGLRDEVLRRDPRRCPKWGFRLAADLAVQLQPRPLLVGWRSTRPQPLFLGTAAQAEGGVGGDVFRQPRKKFLARDGVSRSWLTFEVLDHNPEWRFCATGGCSAYVPHGAYALRHRLLAEMPARLRVFTPQLMLRPACLCCGRPLTDPASIARWIGPECADDGSLTVPGLDLAAGLWARQAVALGLDASTPAPIVHDYALDQQR